MPNAMSHEALQLELDRYVFFGPIPMFFIFHCR